MATNIVHPALADATVFPVALDKNPKLAGGIKSWRNYPKPLPKNATGYGVDCTASGFLVLDVDRNHKSEDGQLVDGVDQWKAILEEHGATQPKTLTVATTSGGYHYYFKAPEGTWLKTGAGDLASAIDTRGTGGYVVGPGSVAWPKVPVLNEDDEPVLDENGDPKLKLDKRQRVAYTVVDDAPVAEIPDWLMELLRSKKMLKTAEDKAREEEEAEAARQKRAAEYAQRQAERAANPDLYGEVKLSEKQRESVETMLSEMASLGDGQNRHNRIFNISRSIGKVVGPDFEHDFLHEAIHAAVASGHGEGCKPGCAERQAESGFLLGIEQHELRTPSLTFDSSHKPSGTAGKSNEKVSSPYEGVHFTGEFFSEGNIAYEFEQAREGQLVSVDEWNSFARFTPEHGIWKRVKAPVVANDLYGWFRDEVYPAVKAETSKWTGEEAERKAQAVMAKAGRFLNLTSCRNSAQFAFGSLMRDASIFDPSKDLINVDGTVVDLATGTQRSAEASDYFTRSAHEDIEVKPGFKSELWEAILAAFLPETREYMQVLIGSALTGHQPKPAGLFFLQADGDNGKSTFADVFLSLLGDYADRMDAKILLDSQDSKTFGKIKIKGKRFLVIEELPKKGQLDAQASKEMAGTERMTGAHKGVDEETFDLEATFLINTNYKLRISETDRGTRKRLKLIPMPYTFLPQDEYDEKVQAWKAGKGADPEELRIRPQDPRLDDAKHNPEVLKAALAWAIEGARKFYANGKRILPDTPAMKAAKAEWLTSQDRVALWWEESVIKDEGHYILASDLYDSYTEHVRANGNHPEALRQFMEMLKSHDLFKESGAEHIQRKVAKGIRSALMEENPEKPGVFRARRLDPAGRAFYVKGLRFKEDKDFEAEAAAEKQEEEAVAQAETDDTFTELTASIASELEASTRADKEAAVPATTDISSDEDIFSDSDIWDSSEAEETTEDESFTMSDAELEDEGILD